MFHLKNLNTNANLSIVELCSFVNNMLVATFTHTLKLNLYVICTIVLNCSFSVVIGCLSLKTSHILKPEHWP